MKTQIVYVLISSDADLFLEELWASLYSLRIYHPEATVKVLTDEPTAKRIYERPNLERMISEVITVTVPKEYTPKERSRVIKTTIRDIIKGSFLYIDTDTIVCHSLEEIDSINFDIAAVPDTHLPLADHPFSRGQINRIKQSLDIDISEADYYFNSGVMFVKDTEKAHELYQRWHTNWVYSSFQKGDKDDQPALIKSDSEMGYIIKRLPDVFNCQLALSLKYFHEAYIVHFFHMGFIKDQSYSPFMGLDIYREIKEANAITPHAEELIRNCKSSFATTTMAVGKSQIYFLFSPTGQVCTMLREKSKKWEKTLNWIAVKILKYYRGKEKIKEKLNNNKK